MEIHLFWKQMHVLRTHMKRIITFEKKWRFIQGNFERNTEQSGKNV
jgi:hypothetical protein